jgi:hypothetical protein
MDRSFWNQWAHSLQRFHLRDFSLVILDGAGPMKVLLAQFMLAGSPFTSTGARSQWRAAAEMLEDQEESRTFADYLREEPVK